MDQHLKLINMLTPLMMQQTAQYGHKLSSEAKYAQICKITQKHNAI